MTSVTLPWPPRDLFPNRARRRHWSQNGRDAKAYRYAAYILTREARVAIAAGNVPVMLTITFCPPDRRNRDDDGCISAFKAARDGFAEAIGIDDKHFRPTYQFADPVANGKVVVSIG